MANTIGNASIVYVDSQISTKISGFMTNDSGKITTDGSGGLTVVKLSSDGGKITTDGSGGLTVGSLTTTGTISGEIEPSKFILPVKTVETLNTSASVGESCFVSNALKPGETTGNGTGTTCYYDGTNWINSASGTTVIA